MPSRGLSLVGFLPEDQGVAWLRQACLWKPARTDDDLRGEWQSANGKIGAAMPKAGKPDISPMDASAGPYLSQLMAVPWVTAAFNNPASLSGGQFAMVEIDPLLAFQLHVDTDRTEHHTATAPGQSTPDLMELLACCLPMTVSSDQYRIELHPGSALITSRSLNIQTAASGRLTPEIFGLQVGASVPFVHVVRYNDRYYLANGYHRTVGMRRRGATHIACVLRDVADAATVGIRPGTFDEQIMESNNPPTIGHFTGGRAHEVSLKAFHRTMHVTWADYITTYE